MVKSFRRTVKRVLDGDTFQVARKIGKSNRVRLANVNAPEKHQFGGKRATNKLRGLIGGKKVTVKVVARDKYGRNVGTVYSSRKNVNKRMKG